MADVTVTLKLTAPAEVMAELDEALELLHRGDEQFDDLTSKQRATLDVREHFRDIVRARRRQQAPVDLEVPIEEGDE